MATKLTLSVDEEKIRKIKRISKKRGRSVSKLFEDFIDDFDRKEKVKDVDINKIIGAFGKAPKNFNVDKAKWEYLKKKYDL
jgi:hypothetical protein